MGACLSLKYGRYNQDLTGSTFSHYSLNSDSSYLDLYPALRYAETGASLTEIDEIQWRRSSVPLMTDWSSMGNVSHFDHSPSLPSPVPMPHPALRPCDSLTTISVREGSAKHGQDESGNGFYWAGQPTSNGLVSRFQNSSTFLLSWETRGGGWSEDSGEAQLFSTRRWRETMTRRRQIKERSKGNTSAKVFSV